jgi:hypothetical protein
VLGKSEARRESAAPRRALCKFPSAAGLRAPQHLIKLLLLSCSICRRVWLQNPESIGVCDVNKFSRTVHYSRTDIGELTHGFWICWISKTDEGNRSGSRTHRCPLRLSKESGMPNLNFQPGVFQFGRFMDRLNNSWISGITHVHQVEAVSCVVGHFEHRYTRVLQGAEVGNNSPL